MRILLARGNLCQASLAGKGDSILSSPKRDREARNP